MTKTYRVSVDCADCAAKIERAITKLEGVEQARLNFLTQKLRISADDARFNEVMDEVERVGRRVERGFALAR